MKKNYPCIYQEEKMDCGMAACATILLHKKISVSLKDLKTLINYDEKQGMSFFQISELCLNFGIVGIGARLYNLDELKDIILPAIIQFKFIQSLHFVVLNEITPSHVIISDPARGVVSLPINQFKQLFTMNVLFFEQNNECIPFV